MRNRRLSILFLTLFSSFLLLVAISSSYAQDERDFLYVLDETKVEEVKPKPKWEVPSKDYGIQLDKAPELERILSVKKYGGEWFQIKDHLGHVIFEREMRVLGSHSYLYRVNLKKVAANDRVLVLHFFEGKSKSFSYKGTARLYFVTILDKDLKKVSFSEGPQIFLEKEDDRSNYFQRSYKWDMKDLDGDKAKEIIIKHNKITYVYRMNEKGKWIKI